MVRVSAALAVLLALGCSSSGSSSSEAVVNEVISAIQTNDLKRIKRQLLQTPVEEFLKACVQEPTGKVRAEFKNMKLALSNEATKSLRQCYLKADTQKWAKATETIRKLGEPKDYSPQCPVLRRYEHSTVSMNVEGKKIRVAIASNMFKNRHYLANFKCFIPKK